MKQWGTEGLAYLTLDADVKEELVHDPEALQSVMSAAKVCILSILYAYMLFLCLAYFGYNNCLGALLFVMQSAKIDLCLCLAFILHLFLRNNHALTLFNKI